MTTERSTTDRMLILACSQRKRSDEGLLPAVERYDGPAFRVLRRFLRGGSSKAPVVLILSAEHGLIPHDLPIAAYDRRMTPARARELRPLVLAELDRMIDSCSSPEILVVAGRQYLPALMRLHLSGTQLLRSAPVLWEGNSLSCMTGSTAIHLNYATIPPCLRRETGCASEGWRYR